MAEQIITKKCSKCKESKPLSEFYKNRAKKDGYNWYCKICEIKAKHKYHQTEKYKAGQKRYRQSEKGKATIKAYAKLYRESENCKANQKRYDQSKKGRARHISYRKQDEIRHPEFYKARTAVGHAVAKGILPKVEILSCSCGKPAKHYHHHKGYAKEHWLDVIPFCTKCHNKITQ